MEIVNLGFLSGVTALFADVHLCAPFLVRVLMLHPVDLQAVTFQGASLGEALLAEVALVRSDPGVRSRVPLKIERVVETLSAERAQVTLDVTVALHVTIEKSLQAKIFAADSASESVRIVVLARWRSSCPLLFASRGCLSLTLDRKWVFNSVTPVDELQLAVARQSQPLLKYTDPLRQWWFSDLACCVLYASRGHSAGWTGRVVHQGTRRRGARRCGVQGAARGSGAR